MIKLIIFDWDDVFTQGSIAAYSKCYHAALKGVGVSIPKDTEKAIIAAKWGAGHAVQLRELLKGHQNLVPRAVEIYQTCLFSDTFFDNLAIVPGGIELLSRLFKRYKLALATGSQPEIIERALRRFNIPDVFAQIMTIYDVDDPVHAKPHPYIVNKIMETQQVSSNETVLVGDAPNDILMARSAGVEPIAVLTGHLDRAKAREMGIERIIGNVTQLERELEKVQS